MVESKEVKTIEKFNSNYVLPNKFNYKKEIVAIVKLDDYESENVKRALNSLIELLGIQDYFKGKKVLLKPNVLSGGKNVFTPPEIITSLIQILKEKGDVKEILVGDSTLTSTITSRSLKSSKIKEMCESEEVSVLNFFKSEREKIRLVNPPHDAEEDIYLPKEVCEADLIINLPKLKTHSGFVYTGAIKNLFGMLGNKQKMHLIHNNKTNFQKMLADIYFAVEETNQTDKPKVLTVMDAVIAMEGKGPQFGKARKIGLMIAGFNSAAVDIIGYTLMNGNPSDLEAINSLARRTDLPVEISQLELQGEKNYQDYIIKNFKKPKIALLKKSGYSLKWLPTGIAKLLMRMSIKINKKKCTLCEQCVKHCPASAMTRKGDKILIDDQKCIECYCCGEGCPNDAIDAKWYLFRIMPYVIIAGIIGFSLILWIIISFIIGIF
ncbi:MAG: DUF362 domain-containing protein [Promethearchaeota archaeon]